ncbi:MAG: hypothetical protein EOO41_03525, partial [Methanobacteriota archaeon]
MHLPAAAMQGGGDGLREQDARNEYEPVPPPLPLPLPLPRAARRSCSQRERRELQRARARLLQPAATVVVKQLAWCRHAATWESGRRSACNQPIVY